MNGPVLPDSMGITFMEREIPSRCCRSHFTQLRAKYFHAAAPLKSRPTQDPRDVNSAVWCARTMKCCMSLRSLHGGLRGATRKRSGGVLVCAACHGHLPVTCRIRDTNIWYFLLLTTTTALLRPLLATTRCNQLLQASALRLPACSSRCASCSALDSCQEGSSSAHEAR